MRLGGYVLAMSVLGTYGGIRGESTQVAATFDIANGVKRAREARELTQATLAEAADTTPETISRVERGMLEPSASLLARLAVALGTSMDSLAGLSPTKAVRSNSDPGVKRVTQHLRRLSPEAVRRVAAVIELIEPQQSRRRSRG